MKGRNKLKNKIVVKVGLVFCILAFWGISLAPPSPASLVATDLVFEGDFQFDLNGMYYVYGRECPLNVLGHLEVFESGNNEKLGDLSLNGQKNISGGEWDGSYFGHWAFDPVNSVARAIPATPATRAIPATPATRAIPATPATRATPAVPANPMGFDCNYEIGIFPDLAQFQEQDENMLGFTLVGFNEVLSIPDELPEIVGLLEGKDFEGSPMPIPTAFLLLSSGLIGLVGLRRRRQ